MARGLLPDRAMATARGQVILQLREALGMTRAEFGGALDWSSVTISRWERGKAEPSRLAFMTILAFAEERGVRHRVRPAASSAPGNGTLPALRPTARRPPASLACESVPAVGRFVSVAAARAGWTAEATFRVSAPPAPTSRRRVGATVGTIGMVAACLCAVLVLGTPGGRRQARPADPAVASPGGPSPRRVAATVHVARVAAPVGVPAAAPLVVAGDPEPVTALPLLARLDGIMVIGAARRATFQVADDAVTVEEGGRLGNQAVTAIATDRVELRSVAGEAHTVPLGAATAFD